MLSQKRLVALKSKSELIAQRIEEASKSPSIDTTTLRHLKKQKLELKEIIAGIRKDEITVH